MEDANSGRRNFIFLSLLLLAFVPYFYLSAFAQPVADDLIYSASVQQKGLLTAYFSEYLNWNGRYSSNLFILNNPMAFGSFDLYKLSPVFLIVVSVLSVNFFLRTLTGGVLKKPEIFTLSLLLTLLYLNQAPILSEGIYWYTGAITYQSSGCLFIVYCGLLVLFFKGHFFMNNKITHLVLLTALLFFMIGFNEVIMPATCFLSFIVWLVSFKNHSQNKNVFLYLFIASTLFSCIMIFSPGNSVRATKFENNHDFFHSLTYSFAQSGRFVFKWVFSAPLLLLSLLYFPLNKKLSENVKLFSNSFYLSPVFSVAFLFLPVFVCAFPAYWGTGILGQHRTMNVALFLFIPLWFINLTVCANALKNSRYSFGTISPKLKVFFLSFIFLSLFFSRNSLDALVDIFSGKAKSFQTQMEHRYNTLVKSRDEMGDSLYLKRISNPPKTLFVLDINETPDHWINLGYIQYFKTNKKIILVKDSLR